MTTLVRSALIGAFALSLSACGGSQEASETAATPEAPPATEETVKKVAEKPAPPAPVKEPSPEFADLPEPYASADYARGKRTFRTCSSCHLLDPDAGNLVGPNLHGMFDRGIGELEGYGYSQAIQNAEFEWTPEKLDEWLANPSTFLPGNNMTFTGVRRERDRQAVIAYLMVETAK